MNIIYLGKTDESGSITDLNTRSYTPSTLPVILNNSNTNGKLFTMIIKDSKNYFLFYLKQFGILFVI